MEDDSVPFEIFQNGPVQQLIQISMITAYQFEELEGPEDDTVGLLSPPMPDGKVACLQCGKRLGSIQAGKRHIASQHQQNQNATCKICHKMFKNESSRDSHSRQKHGITTTMFKHAIKVPQSGPPQSYDY